MLMTVAVASLLSAQALLDPVRVKTVLQAKVDEIYKRAKPPGISAAVVLADGVVVTACAGFSDSAGKVPMTPDNYFCAGSSGKMIVGAVVALLATEGKLDLDKPVVGYVPAKDRSWFDKLPNASALTLRHLLHHTSGLPEHVQDPEFVKVGFASGDEPWSATKLLSYEVGKAPLFAVGEGWSYADTNYIVAAHIAEQVTGKGIFELGVDRILKPAGIKEVVPALSRRQKGLADGLNMPDSPLLQTGWMLAGGQLPFNPQREHAGGGTFTTPRGIAGWAKKLYEGKAVPAAAVKLIIDGVPSKLGRNQQYGLGCMVRPTVSAGLTYGHGGWFPGYLTDVMYLVDHKTALAVQVNTDDFRRMKGSGEAFNREILAALFPK